MRTTPVIPRPVYLFDNYSGALFAYSLRQLAFDYTGPAIKVRRSSDDTEQDIYFDDLGNLDLQEHFVAAHKVTCRDGMTRQTATTQRKQIQSLQSISCTQVAAIKINGEPAISFAGVDESMDIAGISNAASNYSAFSVIQSNPATGGRLLDVQNGICSPSTRRRRWRVF